MIPAPIPANEALRLASLQRMRLLDTPDETAFDRVVRIARRLFSVPIVLFSVVDANRQWFKADVGLGVRQTPRDISFCGHAIHQERMLVVPDARLDARFCDNPLVVGEPHIRFYAGRPIRNTEGHCVGTLCIIDQSPRAFDREDEQALDDLGTWLETGLAQRALGEAQESLIADLKQAVLASMVDPLLGTWNRRGIMEILEREIARSQRDLGTLLVGIGDLDHFKRVNDRFGHPAGDAVLGEAARRLRDALRASDAVGRFGGEEFLVVVPDCSLADAHEVADRLCRAVEAGGPVRWQDHAIPVTISLGFAHAEFVDGADIASDALIVTADRSLYEAKWIGRNRALVRTMR